MENTAKDMKLNIIITKSNFLIILVNTQHKHLIEGTTDAGVDCFNQIR